MAETIDNKAPNSWFMQRKSDRQDKVRARQQRLADARVTKPDDDLIAEAVAEGRVTRVMSPRRTGDA